jgi:hypothetical protein
MTMNKYKITQHYVYADFFIIEANSVDEAYKIVNNHEWEENPDMYYKQLDSYKQFDFQTVELLEDK